MLLASVCRQPSYTGQSPDLQLLSRAVLHVSLARCQFHTVLIPGQVWCACCWLQCPQGALRQFLRGAGVEVSVANAGQVLKLMQWYAACFCSPCHAALLIAVSWSAFSSCAAEQFRHSSLVHFGRHRVTGGRCNAVRQKCMPLLVLYWQYAPCEYEDIVNCGTLTLCRELRSRVNGLPRCVVHVAVLASPLLGWHSPPPLWLILRTKS